MSLVWVEAHSSIRMPTKPEQASAEVLALLPPNLLVYDGQCFLCDRSVQLVLRLNARASADRVIHIAAGQLLLDSPVAEAVPDIKRVLHGTGATVLVQRGEGDSAPAVFRKSAAAFRLGMNLDHWFLRHLSAVAYYTVPTRLGDAVYDFVGARRYKWFGKADACLRPPAILKDRVWTPPGLTLPG
jgi:predicted DCC family thiol-disulfide oxidoreductase YuxK